MKSYFGYDRIKKVVIMMSKISKNIKMLDILSTGKKYTCKELSEKLEVSPRMVRTYKDELEKEGFYIDTIFGKDGGYQLRSKLELPSILFCDADVEKIKLVMRDNKDKKDLEILEQIKEKIINYCRLVEHKEIDDIRKEKLKAIEKAIQNQNSIQIEYHSKGQKKQRIIYPKQIYMYENMIMIVVQYSEDKTDIRHLNLNRIDKIF